MKSVLSGPVTNHFSPLRTQSGAVADGGRLERPRVGAGVRLGDRVGAEPLAPEARLEVSPALVGIGVREDLVRARDEAPQAAGDLAVLLVDEHLLEHRPAAAAHGHRQLAAGEPGLDREPPQLRAALGREPAARPLELDLERLEHVDDEPSGVLAQRLLGRRQRRGPRPRGLSRPRPPRAAVRPVPFPARAAGAVDALAAARPLAVLEDRLRRELARRAHDAAARVRAGAALVVAGDRGPVVRPADRRPHEPHLRREELAREDVALGQADGPLDVERRPDLALEDEAPKPGKNDSIVAWTVSPSRSRSVSQSLSRSSYGAYWTKRAPDRLAGRRHVGIDGRLDRAVEVRPLRVPAVLGVVERALEVLHRRPDVGEAAVLVRPVAERRVARECRRARS